MIYPQLHIAPDSSLSIHLIDTYCESEDNPFMVFGDTDDGTDEAFIILLEAFMNQYAAGYEDGYNDAMYDDYEEGDDEC